MSASSPSVDSILVDSNLKCKLFDPDWIYSTALPGRSLVNCFIYKVAKLFVACSQLQSKKVR